jgi:hypothetical protein
MGALLGELLQDTAFAEEVSAVRGALRATPQGKPNRPLQAENTIAGNIALALSPEARTQLMAAVEPLYPTFAGEHITLILGAKHPSERTSEDISRFQNARVEIYGVANDSHAVQCLLVRVNDEERDAKGRPYHLTWSINMEAEAPGEYNKDGKPSRIGFRHAAYVAAQERFIIGWAAVDVKNFTFSARFYPEAKAPNVTATQVPTA